MAPSLAGIRRETRGGRRTIFHTLVRLGWNLGATALPSRCISPLKRRAAGCGMDDERPFAGVVDGRTNGLPLEGVCAWRCTAEDLPRLERPPMAADLPNVILKKMLAQMSLPL
jgi:hypothetical protein